MIENHYLHSYLLTLRQVQMSTHAATTHTAFVGRIEATRSPAPKVIAAVQLLHLLIFITLYILRCIIKNVTVEKSFTF